MFRFIGVVIVLCAVLVIVGNIKACQLRRDMDRMDTRLEEVENSLGIK